MALALMSRSAVDFSLIKANRFAQGSLSVSEGGRERGTERERERENGIPY